MTFRGVLVSPEKENLEGVLTSARCPTGGESIILNRRKQGLAPAGPWGCCNNKLLGISSKALEGGERKQTNNQKKGKKDGKPTLAGCSFLQSLAVLLIQTAPNFAAQTWTYPTSNERRGKVFLLEHQFIEREREGQQHPAYDPA